MLIGLEWWQDTKDWFTEQSKTVKSWFTTAEKKVENEVKSVTNPAEAKQDLKNFENAVTNEVKTVTGGKSGSDVSGALKSLVQGASGDDSGSSVTDTLGSLVKSATGSGKDSIDLADFMSEASNWFKSAESKVTEAKNSVESAMKSATGGENDFSSIDLDWWQNTKDLFGNAEKKVEGYVTTVTNGVKDAEDTVMGDVGSTVTDTVGSLAKSATGGDSGSSVTDTLGSLVKGATGDDSGSSMSDTLGSLVKSATGGSDKRILAAKPVAGKGKKAKKALKACSKLPWYKSWINTVWGWFGSKMFDCLKLAKKSWMSRFRRTLKTAKSESEA